MIPANSYASSPALITLHTIPHHTYLYATSLGFPPTRSSSTELMYLANIERAREDFPKRLRGAIPNPQMTIVEIKTLPTYRFSMNLSPQDRSHARRIARR